MKKSFRLLVLGILLLSVILLTGCEEESAPYVQSDSEQSYENYTQVPVDKNVYHLRGVVIADPGSLTRQTEAARGSFGGSMYFASGSYFGAEYGGKGFIRLYVLESDVDLAPVGQIVILKSTDTKATMLLPGDVASFKCRKQYEAIAAVMNSEILDEEKMGTWELDYARLSSPVIERISNEELAEIVRKLEGVESTSTTQ